MTSLLKEFKEYRADVARERAPHRERSVYLWLSIVLWVVFGVGIIGSIILGVTFVWWITPAIMIPVSIGAWVLSGFLDWYKDKHRF